MVSIQKELFKDDKTELPAKSDNFLLESSNRLAQRVCMIQQKDQIQSSGNNKYHQYVNAKAPKQ